MTIVGGRSIYGLQFVFPGDLVTLREDIGRPETKARYLGAIRGPRAGDAAHADIRVTGKSNLYPQHTRQAVPLPTVRARKRPEHPVTFATGTDAVKLHYGQAVNYRGGWYRVIGTWGAFAMRLATPYGPREGIRVEYGESMTLLAQSDVTSRIRALYGDNGPYYRTTCGRCGCNALSYDLVSVRGDRDEMVCPYCVAIHDWSEWNWDQGRYELRP